MGTAKTGAMPTLESRCPAHALMNDHLAPLGQANLTLSLYHTEKLLEHQRELLDIPGDSVMPLAPFPNRSIPPRPCRAEALTHVGQDQWLTRNDVEFEVSP